MAGAGILKGLLGIFIALDWMAKQDPTYIILYAVSDALFFFLPVFLAITSARHFKVNVFVAVTLAAAMVYPSIQTLYQTHADVNFLGLPVVMMNYSSSVFPIIILVWLSGYVERFFNRHIHESVRNFVTPFLILVIMFPLLLLTFGPWGIYASEFIASLFKTLYGTSPVLASAVLAGTSQMLVILGVHWGFVPVYINDVAFMGRSYLKAAAAPAIFAQSGAVLAVMLKTRNKKFRGLAASAFVSSLFGITEPAVYGITLKLKRPFLCACVGATAGGAIVGYFQSSAISMGMTSLLTIPIFYGPGFGGFLAGLAVAFVVSAVLAWFVGFEDVPEEGEAATAGTPPARAADLAADKAAAFGEDDDIIMPINGTLVPLSEVNDKAFSSGVVGEGIAIIPEEGRVYAPVDGVVAMTFDSGHAVGIRSARGIEILIHVGIDTVRLQGRHFTCKVTEGQSVKQGELLIEFDLEAIRRDGFDPVTPVIVTNPGEFRRLEIQRQPGLQVGDILMRVA
ncbi:glucose PTS transporter subunit IIA [Brenneria izadpanahii]|uniref:glucose PTS transporter subunit IIA n=1 Tax=Brenneria izadpanahii TaxID=2722756 RepID=UPI001FEBE726|nr:glucose PTS transporter subunit IIA [Brenneria izadpanahii]